MAVRPLTFEKKVLLAVGLAGLAVFFILNLPDPLKIQGDGVFYYSWLHSAVWDRDFDFENQLERFSLTDYHSSRFLEEKITTPTGLIPNPYPPGCALIWLPFVGLADLFSRIGSDFGGDFPTDGYSFFYPLTVNFSGWLFGWLALITVYSSLRKFFSARPALAAVLAAGLATPWLYYQFFEPAMSHSASLFLVSLFWLFNLRLWKRQSVNPYFYGLVVFLMIAVRWQNFLFLPAGLIISRPLSGKRAVKLASWLAPLAASVFFQVWLWRRLYGRWLLIPQGENFINWNIHGLTTLFSSDGGLLWWSPILVFALAGLVFWAGRSRRIFLAVGIAFLAQWLLNSSLSDLGGGEAFGARRFIATLPFLAFGLAAFWEKFGRWPKLVWLAVFLAIAWNFILIENYRLGIIPRAGRFDFRRIDCRKVIFRRWLG